MEKLQEKFGHIFKNAQLLNMALTHRSCGPANNERMEFLGDSILNFVAADLIYELFPNLPEGHLSRIRSGLVREATLVKISERIGLQPHLRVANNDRHFSYIHPSMLADAIEAMFTAVYMDSGLETCRNLIRKHLMIVLQNGEAELKKDSKTMLQELVQGRGYPLPNYSVVRVCDSQKERYEVSCEIPALKVRSTGKGPNRKLAEIAAAENAIKACPR